AFFKEYYSINNVVIAIVGDIKPQEAIQEMEKTFGRIAPRPVPPPLTLKEPEQEGERSVHIEYDANPFFTMAFHRPDFKDPDDAVFDVIESLLSSGRTSLLYKHLVTEKQIAISVSADSSEPGTKYPSLFMISGAPRAPHTLQELEAALWDEITRLKEEPVKEQELQKVINQFDGSLTRSLESNSGLASQLAYFEAVTGDWKYLVRQREKMKAIRPEDVQRVVRKYFTRKNRIVATLSRPENDEKVPQNGGK
ncbi:MAG TPA: pitrilysin family protein, partial [Nitrospiria bacterium]|nr:pitrilysin family protein [Nitrospiria bacterium]